LSEAANSPSWEELIAVLQNDTQRNYRIDIETNSTVDAEATEDKQDISELLNAMSQFLNGIGPMVKDGTMPFDVAQGILLAIVRRYRFGPELEDQLKKMKAPEQGGNAEEVKKREEELTKQEAEFAKQVQAETLKNEQQKAELEMQRKQFEMEKQFAQREMEMQHQFQLKELEMERRFIGQEVTQQMKGAEQNLKQKTQSAQAQLQQARRQPATAKA
jgi:O-acetyl-ADP-ribose deacetylase (regulator of RNase III)